MLGLGQALPAYGLIVLFFVWLGRGDDGDHRAATFALLPVLQHHRRLEQVDKSVIEAGKAWE